MEPQFPAARPTQFILETAVKEGFKARKWPLQQGKEPLSRDDSVGREVIAQADRASTTDPTESFRLRDTSETSPSM
jgi:hypothetical protein